MLEPFTLQLTCFFTDLFLYFFYYLLVGIHWCRKFPTSISSSRGGGAGLKVTHSPTGLLLNNCEPSRVCTAVHSVFLMYNEKEWSVSPNTYLRAWASTAITEVASQEQIAERGLELKIIIYYHSCYGLGLEICHWNSSKSSPKRKQIKSFDQFFESHFSCPTSYVCVFWYTSCAPSGSYFLSSSFWWYLVKEIKYLAKRFLFFRFSYFMLAIYFISIHFAKPCWHRSGFVFAWTVLATFEPYLSFPNLTAVVYSSFLYHSGQQKIWIVQKAARIEAKYDSTSANEE